MTSVCEPLLTAQWCCVRARGSEAISCVRRAERARRETSGRDESKTVTETRRGAENGTRFGAPMATQVRFFRGGGGARKSTRKRVHGPSAALCTPSGPWPVAWQAQTSINYRH